MRSNGAGLRRRVPGIRASMPAYAYRSYNATATVWAFVVAVVLIVLVAWWYGRRRG